MGILQFHIAFSILCLITVVGFAKVFKELIKENGYASDKTKKSYQIYFYFFVPILNVFLVIGILIMISIKKEEIDKLIKKEEK